MTDTLPAAPHNAFEVAERVRWEDVDLVAIVRYSAYTRFFDVGEAELMRAAGLVHPTVVETYRTWLVRRAMHVEYFAPARFDALLRVRAWVGRVGRTSLTLHFEVRDERGETRHAAGYLALVGVDVETFLPKPIPRDVVERLAPFTSP